MKEINISFFPDTGQTILLTLCIEGDLGEGNFSECFRTQCSHEQIESNIVRLRDQAYEIFGVCIGDEDDSDDGFDVNLAGHCKQFKDFVERALGTVTIVDDA